MKKAILIGLAIILVLAIGLKIKTKLELAAQLQEEAAQENGNGKSNLEVVTGLEVKPQTISEVLRVSGEIEAETEVAIQPRTSGRLVGTLVDEGQAVRVNQLLAVMDDETTRLQLQQSEANIAIIQANLQQAEANAARTKTEKERYQELLNQRYISQRDFDNVESAYIAAQATLEAQKAQLTAAQRNYDLQQLQLNQTKIFSPVNGYVLKQQATEGMNLTTGSTIYTVAALDPVRLVFNIDQREAVKLRRGMRVVFTTDAFVDQEFKGTIREVNPSFNPLTRSLTQKVILTNRQGQLMPGMFGEAAIAIGSHQNALVVPQEAIVTQGTQDGLFVVGKKNLVHFQPIQTGLTAEGQVEIVSGLQEGDQVVVMGQNRLRDGQEVKLSNKKKKKDKDKDKEKSQSGSKDQSTLNQSQQKSSPKVGATK